MANALSARSPVRIMLLQHALETAIYEKKTVKTAVAVSGGMDSAYALISLKEAGHQVIALHARFLDVTEEKDAVPGLENLCQKLGVMLAVADLREAFEHHVVQPFIQMYCQGRTPNPCALCNRAMKFGLLREYAVKQLGAQALATGHYAAIIEHELYGRVLRAGADAHKDQSYFLALVAKEALLSCVFPLADKEKTHIRQWLEKRGIAIPLPVESQEICFVPNDHRAFLQARFGATISGMNGDVLLREGDESLHKIAVHHGLWQYTEGQRKGLGIAWKAPLYVLAKNLTENTLIVGEKHMLGATEAVAAQLNMLVPQHLWPQQIFARLRYRQAPAPVQVNLEAGRMLLHFPQAHDLPASGQIAAIYDSQGCLLAGGVLE